MHKGFYIRPGNYMVPEIGMVNTNQPLTDDRAVALYVNKHFPFITLNQEGVKVLKKAKLTPQTVSRLIYQAKTTAEIDLLLKVRSNKLLRKIADVRKNALEK